MCVCVRSTVELYDMTTASSVRAAGRTLRAVVHAQRTLRTKKTEARIMSHLKNQLRSSSGCAKPSTRPGSRLWITASHTLGRRAASHSINCSYSNVATGSCPLLGHDKVDYSESFAPTYSHRAMLRIDPESV